MGHWGIATLELVKRHRSFGPRGLQISVHDVIENL
jgi:hypothetical protein